MITDGLNRIEGISCLRPGGTFYVFPNVSAVDPDGRAFALCAYPPRADGVRPGSHQTSGTMGPQFVELSGGRLLVAWGAVGKVAPDSHPFWFLNDVTVRNDSAFSNGPSGGASSGTGSSAAFWPTTSQE